MCQYKTPQLPLFPILADGQVHLPPLPPSLSFSLQYGWTFSDPGCGHGLTAARRVFATAWPEYLPRAGGREGMAGHSTPTQRKPVTVPKCQTGSARPGGIHVEREQLSAVFFFWCVPASYRTLIPPVYTIWLSWGVWAVSVLNLCVKISPQTGAIFYLLCHTVGGINDLLHTESSVDSQLPSIHVSKLNSVTGSQTMQPCLQAVPSTQHGGGGHAEDGVCRAAWTTWLKFTPLWSTFGPETTTEGEWNDIRAAWPQCYPKARL